MDLAIASLVSLCSSGGICYLTYHLLKQNTQFKGLNEAKLYSPSSLISEFQNPRKKDTFSQRKADPNEYVTNAFVEGYVYCREPIRSHVNRRANLAYSLIYKQEIREKNPLLEVLNVHLNESVEKHVNAPLYFQLKDAHTPQYCLVHRNLEVDASTAVQKIGESQEMKPFKVFENLVDTIGRIFGQVNYNTRSLLSLKGISIGMSETEFGIKIGSALTVYGQFIYNMKDKSLRIDSPLYFLKDRGMLLNIIKEKIGNLQGGIIFLLAAFAISTAYLVTKGRIYLQERREKQLYKYNKGRLGGETLNEDYKCVICCDRPRDIILKPCMHFSICKHCYQSLNQNVCPICKKEIKDTMNVYFP